VPASSWQQLDIRRFYDPQPWPRNISLRLPHPAKALLNWAKHSTWYHQGGSLTPQAGSLPVASTPPRSARRTLVDFSRIPSHVSASHPSIRHDTTWQAQSRQEPTSRTAEPPRARVCFIYSTNQALICGHHAYRSSPIGARDKSTWSRSSHTFAMRLALWYSCNLPTTQSALYKLQPGRRQCPTRQLRLAVSSGVQLIRNAPSDLSDNFLIK
jgi:hypothetical protein